MTRLNLKKIIIKFLKLIKKKVYLTYKLFILSNNFNQNHK
jgi:hypothetical protein